MTKFGLGIKNWLKQKFYETPTMVLATIVSIACGSGFLVATGVAFGIPAVNTFIHIGIVALFATIYCVLALRKDDKELPLRKDSY